MLPKDFATFEHAYLREYIGVADRKAGFFFTVASLFLGYLINNNALVPLSLAVQKWFWYQFAGIASVFLLVLAMVFSLGTVFPRLTNPRKNPVEEAPVPGIIFWEDVTAWKSPERYASNVLALEKDKITAHIFEHCYLLSQVALKKYSLLKISGILLAIAVVSGVLFLALNNS